MPKTPKSRSLTLFYILVAYVFLQLLWWATHIIQLTSQLGEGDDYTTRRIWMIVGEGAVFFLLLTFGVYKIRKSFKEEVKLAQQKQNFALSVSHELKSPLAAIKLFLQTLNKRDLPEEQRRDILNKSISNANRLDSLVNNILLSNVVETKNYELSKEVFNLKKLGEDLVHEFKQTQPKAVINFSFSGKEDIQHDKSIFSSVLTNLLDNAIKYSENNTPIALTLNIENDSANVTIIDEGQGIKDDEKLSVFDKFYRSGNEITRKTKGTGLGLFIVHELVRISNGQITIEDNKPKGTIFKVRIPL